MENETRKAGASFAENRKNMLVELQASAGCGVVEKSVNFDNDDVPTFLSRLKDFERKSREAVIIIK